MKKVFLATVMIASASSAFAACGQVAGYDSSGKALYYDDCTSLQATTVTGTTGTTVNTSIVAAEWSGQIIDTGINSDITTVDACANVTCPSDMSCSNGCCTF